MLVVGVVALVVVGPEKLPEAARTIGKIYYQLKRAGAEVSRTFSAEIDLLGSEVAEAGKASDDNSPKTADGRAEERKKTEVAEDA